MTSITQTLRELHTTVQEICFICGLDSNDISSLYEIYRGKRGPSEDHDKLSDYKLSNFKQFDYFKALAPATWQLLILAGNMDTIKNVEEVMNELIRNRWRDATNMQKFHRNGKGSIESFKRISGYNTLPLFEQEARLASKVSSPMFDINFFDSLWIFVGGDRRLLSKIPKTILRGGSNQLPRTDSIESVGPRIVSRARPQNESTQESIMRSVGRLMRFITFSSENEETDEINSENIEELALAMANQHQLDTLRHNQEMMRMKQEGELLREQEKQRRLILEEQQKSTMSDVQQATRDMKLQVATAAKEHVEGVLSSSQDDVREAKKRIKERRNIGFILRNLLMGMVVVGSAGAMKAVYETNKELQSILPMCEYKSVMKNVGGVTGFLGSEMEVSVLPTKGFPRELTTISGAEEEATWTGRVIAPVKGMAGVDVNCADAHYRSAMPDKCGGIWRPIQVSPPSPKLIKLFRENIAQGIVDDKRNVELAKTVENWLIGKEGKCQKGWFSECPVIPKDQEIFYMFMDSLVRTQDPEQGVPETDLKQICNPWPQRSQGWTSGITNTFSDIKIWIFSTLIDILKLGGNLGYGFMMAIPFIGMSVCVAQLMKLNNDQIRDEKRLTDLIREAQKHEGTELHKMSKIGSELERLQHLSFLDAPQRARPRGAAPPHSAIAEGSSQPDPEPESEPDPEPESEGNLPPLVGGARLRRRKATRRRASTKRRKATRRRTSTKRRKATRRRASTKRRTSTKRRKATRRRKLRNTRQRGGALPSAPPAFNPDHRTSRGAQPTIPFEDKGEIPFAHAVQVAHAVPVTPETRPCSNWQCQCLYN
jgi:hypothetical protein